jgi:hypothetical protein
MRNIKSVIPEHIFHKYAHTYLWIINDCAFRAPEIFFVSWNALQELLIKIKSDHPDESFIDDVRKIFNVKV